MSAIKERIRGVVGEEAFAPLAILFGLNFVDELDRIAFGVAIPKVAHTFDISKASVAGISTLVGVTVLIAVLPVSYLADRFNRVRIIAFAALAWMSMSVPVEFVVPVHSLPATATPM